jgi:hypothetical protein
MSNGEDEGGQPTWVCSKCGARNTGDVETCPACWLAMTGSQEPRPNPAPQERREDQEEVIRWLWDREATRAYRAVVFFLLCPLLGPFCSLQWLFCVGEHRHELSPAGRLTFYAAVFINVVGVVVNVILLGGVVVYMSL